MPGLPSNNPPPGVKSGLVNRRRIAWGLAIACLVAALGGWAFSPHKPRERRPLGLMTTLPIYWGEVAGVDEMIVNPAPPHWVRSALEQDYQLVPIDTLAGPGGLAARAAIDRIFLAQPRALSGPENVALDNWVRGGGQMLLFADPMLTGHSRFPIGDRRRPQDVVLLSPILARWGLELQFDVAQAHGERVVPFGAIDLPVDLPGTLRVAREVPGAPADCALAAGGLVADCAIGRGRVLIIADAAILDQDAGGSGRETALRALTDQAFPER